MPSMSNGLDGRVVVGVDMKRMNQERDIMVLKQS